MESRSASVASGRIHNRRWTMPTASNAASPCRAARIFVISTNTSRKNEPFDNARTFPDEPRRARSSRATPPWTCSAIHDTNACAPRPRSPPPHRPRRPRSRPKLPPPNASRRRRRRTCADRAFSPRRISVLTARKRSRSMPSHRGWFTRESMGSFTPSSLASSSWSSSSFGLWRSSSRGSPRPGVDQQGQVVREDLGELAAGSVAVGVVARGEDVRDVVHDAIGGGVLEDDAAVALAAVGEVREAVEVRVDERAERGTALARCVGVGSDRVQDLRQARARGSLLSLGLLLVVRRGGAARSRVARGIAGGGHGGAVGRGGRGLARRQSRSPLHLPRRHFHAEGVVRRGDGSAVRTRARDRQPERTGAETLPHAAEARAHLARRTHRARIRGAPPRLLHCPRLTSRHFDRRQMAGRERVHQRSGNRSRRDRNT